MGFEWVAIALTDVTWLSLAFALGFLAKQINLPPLVGFLATGFVLNYFGVVGGESLEKLADLGITLLLFSVGLKLNLKLLIKPQVWSVTILHMVLVITLFGAGIFALSKLNLPVFNGLDLKLALMVAFALSFSSTVFVVKSLEAKGEINSIHGQISIGILVMQDLIAVGFLAISMGKVPSLWALLLFLIIPLRPLFHKLLSKIGHGELLVLYALVLAIGGAEMFELGGVKDDLGALAMGILMSSHVKAKEMAKSMLGFKDLFLVGFFLNIGISGTLTLELFIIGLLLVPFIFIKSSLFFILMTRFKLRARTSLLASINLSNYSEFGLIVAAIGVANGWLQGEWLVILAIAVSISFILAAILNGVDNHLYNRRKPFWLKFQTATRLPDDKMIQIDNETIAIFGMGRVGRGAYDKMYTIYGDAVVGIDFDTQVVERSEGTSRKVIYGDPSDADFWEKVDRNHSIEVLMLALPNLETNIEAIEQLKDINFKGRITAIARYPDEVTLLKQAGATEAYDFYSEAGSGYAEHILDNTPTDSKV